MTRKSSPPEFSSRSTPKEELITERLFEEEAAAPKKTRRTGVTIDVDPIVVEFADVKAPRRASSEEEFAVSVEPSSAEPPQSSAETRVKETKPRTARQKTKATKPLRAPKPKRVKSLYLLVDALGSRSRMFRVRGEGLESVDSCPRKAQVISISNVDARISAEEALSSREARTLAGETLFEPAYVLNCSKTAHAVYATTRARADELTYQLAPGIAILDAIHSDDSSKESGSLFGWRLRDVQGKDAVVALYHRSPSGFVSAPLVAIYPEDADATVRQFRATQQASGATPLVLFEHTELLKAGTNLACYPRTPLLGITLKHVTWTALMLMSLAFALQSGVQVRAAWRVLDQQQAQIAAQEARLQAGIGPASR